MQEKKQVYYKYFEESILPIVRPLEKQRKKTVFKLIFFSVLFFITGLIFAALFIFNALYHLVNPVILPVLLFLMYAFILKSITDVIVASRDYRKNLVKNVLPLFFVPVANFKNWPKNYDIEALINSKLFSNFDSREDDLSFFGHYKGCNIIISSTKLTIPVNTDIFKGTLIQLELPKNNDNHVILLSDNEKPHCHYQKLKSIFKGLKIYCKKTDSLDFMNEDLYDVIQCFAKFYNAKSFSMSLRENVALVAIRQKFSMQFGSVFKSLLKPKNYDELIERFTVIYDLIDILS